MKKFFYRAVALSLILSSVAVSAFAEVEEEAPVVVLGGGIGALTSAIYLARSGVTPIVIEGKVPGGAITQSYCVQNWPGEVEISGFELTEKVRRQAEQSGALFRSEELIAVDFSKRPFTITTRDLNAPHQTHVIKTHSAIIAMGSTPNCLGVPGEQGASGYWSKGVYTCAICDGGLFKDKEVAVIGGGDSALLEAQYLSNIAKKVYIIVRKGSFRAVDELRKEDVLARSNVQVFYNSVVKEITGDEKKVTKLILQKGAQASLTELSVDGVFLAIGARPNTELLRSQLELDPNGYVVLKEGQRTSVAGVYAVGDIADPFYKQAISAAGDGAKAALDVQNYLAVQKVGRKLITINLEKALLNRQIVEVTNVAQFEKELAASKGLVFVDFYAPWCHPCRSFAPVFENWSKEYSGKIKFIRVDVTAVSELSFRYAVQGVPALIILDPAGKVVRKSVGTNEISEVETKLQKLQGSEVINSEQFRG